MADQQKHKIYFLGAGPFAVAPLEFLTKSANLELVGVGTQPDKPAGRKRVLTPSPLGIWADAHHIPCERIPSVNTEEFLAHIKELAPELIVVVSFGQLLREPLLMSAPCGCLNIHASILPKYRGASPIATAVLNGDPVSGVAFMKMEKGLDTGPVYEIHPMELPIDITTDELERQLSWIAGEKLESCILRVISGEMKPVPQNHAAATQSRKIRKTDGSVNWGEDAAVIDRKIRAYLNWPSMSFRIDHQGRIMNVKIRKAGYTAWNPGGDPVPGKFVAYTNNKMVISCGKGSIILERLLPEGKKEMSVADFLNGCRLTVGDILLNGPEPVVK